MPSPEPGRVTPHPASQKVATDSGWPPSAILYRLEDLGNHTWPPFPLAVLGQPVRHSLSPAMHNAALLDMAGSQPEFANWRYYKFEVSPETLPEALERFHQTGFYGLNLTIPHKENAVKLVESINGEAEPMGAVNTLRRTPNGYEAWNTDGYGLLEALRRDLETHPSQRPVILLGAGGAARAAAVACLRAGCPSLYLGNRTSGRAHQLANELRRTMPHSSSAQIFPFSLPDPDVRLPEDSLLINATSVGLNPDDPAPITAKCLPRGLVCLDMIYNPMRTRLLETVAGAGGKTANGLSMLVHQGVRSLAIWTGSCVPEAIMEQAARQALASK